MPKYAYKVRDQQGRLVEGTTDAMSVDECMQRLEDKSLVPIAIEELNFDGSIKNRSFVDRLGEWFARRQNRVPYRDVVFFTRQLATMINGGVSLPRAVDQLSWNEKPGFKRVLNQISEDIGMGSTFSDALARHPSVFNNMFVAVVRAGEAAGALDRVLQQLSDYMENVEAMKAKVKAAMRYPTVIAGFVGAVITGILLFLVPIFQDMYAGFGAELPGLTMVLINISDAIRYNALITIGIVVAILAAIIALFNMDTPNYLYNKYIYKLPIFGPILRKNTLSIYCRTMALLMESGTPILEATQISGAAVNNRHYARALEEVYNNLRQGELLSTALSRHKEEFPILVVQLLQTGEESGKIDELLVKAAEFYDREVKNVVDSLASIIEPILIIVLGGIVGFILIALYLPIFSIGKIIR